MSAKDLRHIYSVHALNLLSMIAFYPGAVEAQQVKGCNCNRSLRRALKSEIPGD